MKNIAVSRLGDRLLLLCVLIFTTTISCSKNLNLNLEIGSCESEGLSSEKVSVLLNTLIAKRADVDAFLLTANGRIVCEFYSPHFVNKPLHVASCTKGIMSILISIAVDKKIISSKSQHISDYLMPYISVFPDKKDIRIIDALRMRSGIDWNINKEDLELGILKARNPIEYYLSRKKLVKRGEIFDYSSANYFLIGEVIENASSLTLKEFSDAELFKRLGISNFKWNKTFGGIYNAGAGIEITARDLSKIGILMLNKGVYAGKRIFSEKAYSQMTTAYGQSGDTWEYGEGWWINDLGGFHAWGWRERYLFVFPKEKITLVIYANSPNAKSLYKKIRKPLEEILLSKKNTRIKEDTLGIAHLNEKIYEITNSLPKPNFPNIEGTFNIESHEFLSHLIMENNGEFYTLNFYTKDGDIISSRAGKDFYYNNEYFLVKGSLMPPKSLVFTYKNFSLGVHKDQFIHVKENGEIVFSEFFWDDRKLSSSKLTPR